MKDFRFFVQTKDNRCVVFGRDNKQPYCCYIDYNLERTLDSKFQIVIQNLNLKRTYKEIRQKLLPSMPPCPNITNLDFLENLEHYCGVDYVNKTVYITEDVSIKFKGLSKPGLRLLKNKITKMKEQGEVSVVSHRGGKSELDKQMSVLCIAKLASDKKKGEIYKYNDINIIEVEAGDGGPKGYIILDVKYSGRKMDLNRQTFVFDHHDGSAKNTLEKLKRFGLHVPNDALLLADRKPPIPISPFEQIWFNIYRYLQPEEKWKLLDHKGMYKKPVSTYFLKTNGFYKKFKKDCKNLEKSVMILHQHLVKTSKYGLACIVPSKVKMGSILATEHLDADMYVSVSSRSNGSTFVIMKSRYSDPLDQKLIDFVKQKITSNVFITSDKRMICCGSSKDSTYIKIKPEVLYGKLYESLI